MIALQILLLLICIVAEPCILGVLISRKKDSLPLIWGRGYLVMLALLLIPGVVCCYRQTKLKTFLICYAAVLIAADLAALIILVKRMLAGKISDKRALSESGSVKKEKTTAGIRVLQVIAITLILVQCVVPTVFQHTDADDSTYVALSTVAVDRNRVLSYGPKAGGKIDLTKPGNMNAKVISPMHLLYASVSKITKIRPAVLCHTALPFFFILIAYVFYLEVAKLLFGKDREKCLYFLIFVSLAHLFSGFSVYTAGTFLLSRIWQGKAQFAGMIVPAIAALYLNIYKDKMDIKNCAGLMVTIMAANVMSPTGCIMSLLCTGIYAVVTSVFKRQFKVLLFSVLAALPSLLILAFYALKLR